eukprot:GSMAST32.ASY1.ANO1.1479.1 assembled CDS
MALQSNKISKENDSLQSNKISKENDSSFPRPPLPHVKLQTSSATVIVCLHGGHITSWTLNGSEILFLSEKAVFKPPKAIRGGIPICFPQFSDCGPMKKSHGFARTLTWTHDSDIIQHRNDKDEITSCSTSLSLSTFVKSWPYKYNLKMHISITENTLQQDLIVTNNGKQKFEFTAALHTYFRLNTNATKVNGLLGCTYLDSLDNRTRKTESEKEITIENEMDRIYLNAPSNIILQDDTTCINVFSDHSSNTNNTQGFRDGVLWNPWIEKSKRMLVFLTFKIMVRVRVAQINNKIVLDVGEEWKGSQKIVVSKVK